MKNLKIKSVLMIAFAISTSSVIYARHDHSKMNMNQDNKTMMNKHSQNMVKLKDKNLTNAYMHYTMINEALFKEDVVKVQMASKMLVEILNTYGNAPEVVEVATELASKTEVKQQRALFSKLTNAFEPLLKGNIVEGEIFKTFCPMANDGGSYWFSNSSDIANPYYGKAMATCGSVKETFKSM